MSPDDLLAHQDNGRYWPDWPAPLFTDAAQAYRAALAVRERRIARGERPVGFKVGFTNRTIWPRYGVYAPVWGTVWDTTFVQCADAGRLSLADTCEPRLEPECVFGLRATPRADAGLDDLFDALEWVAPGFELVQSHRIGWRFSAAETIADNGLHARLLVGARRPVRELARHAHELHTLLAQATIDLLRGDQPVERGNGAHVLDSPLAALQHFVRELRRCPGAPDLAAGDMVTTGTWTDAWPVRPGERWHARFSAPLPALSVHLE